MFNELKVHEVFKLFYVCLGVFMSSKHLGTSGSWGALGSYVVLVFLMLAYIVYKLLIKFKP